MQEEKIRERLIRDGLDDLLERVMQEQELLGEYRQKELEDVVAALRKQGYTNEEIIKALQEQRRP